MEEWDWGTWELGTAFEELMKGPILNFNCLASSSSSSSCFSFLGLPNKSCSPFHHYSSHLRRLAASDTIQVYVYNNFVSDPPFCHISL